MSAPQAQQEDENGRSCCNRMVSNSDLCSKGLACSADPQRRSALAGLRHLAELKAEGPLQRAAESRTDSALQLVAL